jgi:APA family basic amino acid/polyamine antiporter
VQGPPNEPALRRELGLSAAVAVVAGNMLGSGIFFTPGELAAIASSPAQVYLFWALCGLITLCGALTLAELSTLLPRSGATFHIIREGFGPFWGFLKVWMEMWVSGPGSIAGLAILFGTFGAELIGGRAAHLRVALGVAAIWVFTAINLLGVRWGGRTQVLLTATKLLALLALIVGSVLLAPAAAAGAAGASPAPDLWGLLRFVGLGVAAVLFTYDGWIDLTHVAGEVEDPRRDLPRGLTLGVGSIMGLYLLVNYAFLRAVPLDEMRAAPTSVATAVAQAAFGAAGGRWITGLIVLSTLGALGGLVMTLPRLYFAGACQHAPWLAPAHPLGGLFRGLARVSRRTNVPAGAVWFAAIFSSAVLLFFQSFSRLVNFFVVANYFFIILMVAAVFPLRRRRPPDAAGYRTPLYPWTPLLFIGVIAVFLASALIQRPLDTLLGVGLTLTGVPIYRWLCPRRP